MNVSTISESFGISTVVMVLSIGMGEEMVFRGLFLNALLKDRKKYLAVFVNALLFLAIHFPVWIQSGSFVSVFTGGEFISVLLLSCIFSAVFIRTKSIWTAFFTFLVGLTDVSVLIRESPVAWAGHRKVVE